MVSNNINAKNIPMQAGVPQPLPSMQGVDPEKLKQSVDNSYLANRMKASTGEDSNPLATFGTGAAVWYGLSRGMDKFNEKCAGDFDKSLFGKVAEFGDKISDKAGSTAAGQKMNGAINSVKGFWNKLTGKSKIAYTLANHSTSPECDMAKTSAKGIEGFLAADAHQVFDEFLKPISNNKRGINLFFFTIPLGKSNSFQKLEQYGVDQKYIDDFVNGLKGKTFAEKALALQKEELKLLGASDDMVKKLFDKKGIEGLQKLAYNLKVRKLGFKSVAEYKAIGRNMIDNAEKVIQALSKSDKNINISIWRSNGFWGKIKSHFFGRKVSLSEYYNKYLVATGNGGKTKLGKGLTKALGYFMEGTTNRFAGGKLAVIMQAGIFADMLVHTFKAPKGEKGKTFGERFVNDFTFFMALPLGIMGMHKLGGFKYAGLDKEGVKVYRQKLAEFNAKVKSGALNDKKLYKQASKELNKYLGSANIKNPITKILHYAGRFINKGNEKKLAYRSIKKFNMNLFRKMFNGNIIGVPLRIAIPMMIVSPFLAKYATKAAHAIFGKPTKSVLDEDKEEKKPEMSPEQQAELQKLYEEYQKQQQAQAAAAAAKKAEPLISNNSPTNLLSMAKSGQPYKENIPHNETPKAEQPKKPTYTYVPSPESVIAPNASADLTPAQAAIQKADSIEQKVAETLSMRR